MPSIKEEYRSLLKAEKIAAIVSDLDNTLWSGILAEKQKTALNKSYYEFLKTLHKKGIQLLIVSKNDEEDVIKTFKKLGIDKELFTAVITNWDAKYLNIERLLRLTQLRPETVIFIDDNPAELIEVKAKMPAIHAINAHDWNILKDHPYLRSRKQQTSSEIQERINRYRTAITAEKFKVKAKSDIEFFRKLKREISIGEVSGENIDRFTRLLYETHRINLNPGKFTKLDDAIDYLHERINKGDKLFAISARENEIPLGFIGALIIHIDGKRAQLTDGTFSCGVIGRDFEQKALLALIDILKKQGITELQFFVTLTSTNKRVREMFGEFGFKELRRKGEQVIYIADLKRFQPKKRYPWISILTTPPELEYLGEHDVIEFLEKYVKPVMKRTKVVNLGSARGEVMGHLQKEQRDKFYEFVHENQIIYQKVDMQHYPDERNIVANAEDLQVFKDNSQDVVMAVELLEHTEHFWKVLNEMVRICKTGGYLFITAPTFNFPKHEYPIDLWRIGPKTMKSFFPQPAFKIVKLATTGKKNLPRRVLILVKKIKKVKPNYGPLKGQLNWQTGLTIFP